MAAAGRVDILVNYAGGVLGQVGQPIEEVSVEDWHSIVAVNLSGAFLMARAVAPAMKAQRYGRIVNISSGAGRSVSLTGIQAYASAKAGQIGLTRQLAHELGPWGITVNNIAPGFVLEQPHHAAAVGVVRRAGPARAGGGSGAQAARHGRGHRPWRAVLRLRLRRLVYRPGAEHRRRPRHVLRRPGKESACVSDARGAISRRSASASWRNCSTSCASPASAPIPAHRADVREAAQWVAAQLRAAGPFTVEIAGDGRPPRRLRRVAGRAGPPDAAGLRPLRRAAGRSAGPLALGAVRPERARRAHLRARRQRRQGPHVHPHQGGRGVFRRGWPAAAQPQAAVRGRGGDRQPAPGRLRDALRASGWPPTTPSAPTARCGASTSRRSPSAAAGMVALDVEVRGPRTDLHSGRHGGAVQNPLHALAELVAGLHRPDGAVAVAGFYDAVRALERRGARRDRRAAASTRSSIADELGVPALYGEHGLQHAGAPVGAPDAGGQRALRRLPGRGLEDGDPGHGARPRSPAAWSRTSSPTRCCGW